MLLKNKVAIVTGGGQGIGKGIAEDFFDEGAIVIIADKNEIKGLEVAESLESANPDRVLFIKTDVTRSESIKHMIDITLERFGQIDILVNNAGYHISKSVEDTEEDEWDFIINTNLKSTYLASKYAIPHLRVSQGCIIIISSMVGIVGQKNAGAYASSKAGQLGLTKNMALDLAPDKIRVNAICPGWVQTPLVEYWFSQQPDPRAARDQILSLHPLGRIGTVKEVSNAAVFLASEKGSFITGTEIKIDGAITLGY